MVGVGGRGRASGRAEGRQIINQKAVLSSCPPQPTLVLEGLKLMHQ